MAAEKDTIYIDIDDEITGIIDKVRASDGKIVALVLPKRATVFQSIVNMKLLKRTASAAKKNLVLITTESGLLPLAGAAGLHVASSLNAKPEIPRAPIAPVDIEEEVEEIDDGSDEVTAENAGDQPVGELAGLGAAAAASNEVETVDFDNEEPEDAAKVAGAGGAAAVAAKKNKKLAVPNFERFRLWIILGGAALVLLIVGFIFAVIVLPKATIAIDTDASSISVDENVKLSTTAKSVDLADGILPAKLVKQTKTYTQQAPATGEKNNGNKAEGEIVVSAGSCTADVPASVPAGTGVSSAGKTYITQDTASFEPSISGGKCTYRSDSVGIVAQSGGSNFNVSSGTSFTVAGSGHSATGSASGGTDNIIKVVSQSDIDAAKGKINTSDPAVKKALETDLKGDNYFPITATFVAAEPKTTLSSDVGDAASSVTVTAIVDYTMFGVQEADLKELIENSVKEQIDISKQNIINDGVDDAVFNVSAQTEKEAELSMHTEVAVGPDLDVEAIKQDAAGKKPGEVKAALESSPDVNNVQIKMSPFWVSSIPKKTSKITVVIEKPKPVANDSNAE